MRNPQATKSQEHPSTRPCFLGGGGGAPGKPSLFSPSLFHYFLHFIPSHIYSLKSQNYTASIFLSTSPNKPKGYKKSHRDASTRQWYHQKGNFIQSRIHYWSTHNTGKFEAMFCITNAGFRLTCRLPHCRFDDDISSTAQTSLAAEGWPSGKQRQANRSITLPLCPLRQIADSWILFNSGAIAARWKAKAALPLRAATLKQQAMITRRSGNAASGKLVWN